MTKLNSESEKTKQELLCRLGVNTSHDFVTMIVITKNAWDGHSILRELQIECELIYKRQIDTTKIKSVVLRDLESASRSPHLEKASFIIIPDENLLGAENYPELKHILPFMD